MIHSSINNREVGEVDVEEEALTEEVGEEEEEVDIGEVGEEGVVTEVDIMDTIRIIRVML